MQTHIDIAIIRSVRFNVLTAASMKMAVFLVIAPCSLVEVCRRFRAIALMMEAINSETSVKFYQTARCYNPEDRYHHYTFILCILCKEQTVPQYAEINAFNFLTPCHCTDCDYKPRQHLTIIFQA
jgi:hypothetical protein